MRHIVIDGKEYTEFTSYKGKSEGKVVRVPRRVHTKKWAHVKEGHYLVGPVCTSKHGKRRLIVRLRPRELIVGKKKGLLHMTNFNAIVTAQKEKVKVHFVDDDSMVLYRKMLDAMAHGHQFEKLRPTNGKGESQNLRSSS
jgi:hypothetical protein